MSFNLAKIRLAVMEAIGRKDEIKPRDPRNADNPYYYKLPADVSTHPAWIEWKAPLSEWPARQGYLGEDGREYRIKVVSSAEAKRLNPRAVRPHRIYVWDEVCDRWLLAGKYCQHCKSITHKIRKSAAENLAIPTEYSAAGNYCSTCDLHDAWCEHIAPPAKEQAEDLNPRKN